MWETDGEIKTLIKQCKLTKACLAKHNICHPIFFTMPFYHRYNTHEMSPQARTKLAWGASRNIICCLFQDRKVTGKLSKDFMVRLLLNFTFLYVLFYWFSYLMMMMMMMLLVCLYPLCRAHVVRVIRKEVQCQVGLLQYTGQQLHLRIGVCCGETVLRWLSYTDTHTHTHYHL